MLLNSLVVLATVLGSWMAFPQARRLARTRRIEGVSAVWIGVSLAINGWWLTYGLAAGVWALVPVSAISLVLYASMAAIYVATVGRPSLTPMALGVFGLGMIPLPFLIIGGWQLAAIAVGLSYGIQLLPAVVSACRTRDLVGVSASTWLIAWVEAAALAGLRTRRRRHGAHAGRSRRGDHGVGHPGPPRSHRTRPLRGARSAPPSGRHLAGVITARDVARWTIAQRSLV